jgi:hypothetical protein
MAWFNIITEEIINNNEVAVQRQVGFCSGVFTLFIVQKNLPVPLCCAARYVCPAKLILNLDITGLRLIPLSFPAFHILSLPQSNHPFIRSLFFPGCID